MNKKRLFFLFFFCAFSFLPALIASRASRSQTSRLALAISFLLPTLFSSSPSFFFFRNCFSSWTQPLFEQMIFWVCTSPRSYQAKSAMSSLLLIFLLSWPSLINIAKEDLLHVAARCNSLHLSKLGYWGGLKYALCHSFANKTWFPFPSLRHSSWTSSIKYVETIKNAERRIMKGAYRGVKNIIYSRRL